MTTQKINSLPPFTNMRYVESSGYMTNDSRSYNDNMWQTLNQIVEFFRLGVQYPQYTTTEIDGFRLDDTVPVGTVWYNITSKKLNLKTATSA